MPRFEQFRQRPRCELDAPRELMLAVSPLRSSVNLSRLVRLAGCSGIRDILYCGSGRVDRTIARDAAEYVTITTRRSLAPAVAKLKHQGYRLVGLEQTTHSQILYDYQFARQSVLVIGAEREGLTQDVLDVLDDVVEIPVYGVPASFNVVTATTMAVYEYCRQFPRG